jgi:hypothetical protein
MIYLHSALTRHSIFWVYTISLLLSGEAMFCQVSSSSAGHSQLIAAADSSTTYKVDGKTRPAVLMPGTMPVAAASFQSNSLFDIAANNILPLTTTVEVQAEINELNTSGPMPFQAGGRELLDSAGTFGDVSRYLQTFPGVVATSDLSNEMLVRGGHPMENLFLVDGIEMPNINHLAMMGTTGGMAPMIDSAVIQDVKLYTGGYGSEYSERLSSETAIELLDSKNQSVHVEADLGIQGVGGLMEKQLHHGSILASGHQSFLSLLSNAMNLGGLPSYANELARFRHSLSDTNQLSILYVGGRDSYSNTPCATDGLETSTIDSQYSGFRETTGAEWRSEYTARSFGVVTVSDSEDTEQINQQDQLLNPVHPARVKGTCPLPAAESVSTPVYMENSNNAFSTANYRYEVALSKFSLTSGTSFRLQHPNIRIDQPVGAFTPYSAIPTRVDTTSLNTQFASGESGTFTQLTMHPARSLSLDAGGRLQTFAFGSQTTLTPRFSVRYGLSEAITIHAAYARYAQMPAFIYRLAYPGNRSMLPMRATHEIVGIDIGGIPSSTVRIEAYNKPYSDIPASTEYPSVTLHDMVDMLGQQFVWLPMNSRGYGTASGIELSDITRVHSFHMQGSVAYSRAKFAGLDHVLRPSNYDFPWIANLAAVQQLKRGFVVSTRYGYATGRPITPFDLSDSLRQNRPIYDVTHMNSERAPYYQRWDAQTTKDLIFHHRHLMIYAGVDNILNRSNFLAYAWMPRDNGSKTRKPVALVNQIPIFPNFGLRLIVR